MEHTEHPIIDLRHRDRLHRLMIDFALRGRGHQNILSPWRAAGGGVGGGVAPACLPLGHTIAPVPLSMIWRPSGVRFHSEVPFLIPRRAFPTFLMVPSSRSCSRS